MYEFRARITGDVSVQYSNTVTVGRKSLSGTGEERGREASKRPAFDMTTLSSGFVDQFATMAEASSTVAAYTYEAKPTLRQVALDFVDDKLGAGWNVGASYWPSRWTPEGWVPYFSGDPGATFTLTVAGARPGSPYLLMKRYTSRRHFYLQFFVSVEQV